MFKTLVSHESPLALLDESRSYNDYDYCLVHLLPIYEQYLNFFKKSKEMGRKILLDNSLFELGTAFNSKEFVKWINIIQPDEYVVPDVFSDSIGTIASFKQWLKVYDKRVKGKKIGVVQGRTYQEMVDCYKFMSKYADKIAINFISSYFSTTGHTSSKLATQWHILMNGRQKFIFDLIEDDFWNNEKPHHLLGCTLPQEFFEYESINNIESIDTSNPVVAGMHNIRYKKYGLNDKISTKLVDLIESDITSANKKNILYNIAMFRKINDIKGN